MIFYDFLMLINKLEFDSFSFIYLVFYKWIFLYSFYYFIFINHQGHKIFVRYHPFIPIFFIQVLTFLFFFTFYKLYLILIILCDNNSYYTKFNEYNIYSNKNNYFKDHYNVKIQASNWTSMLSYHIPVIYYPSFVQNTPLPLIISCQKLPWNYYPFERINFPKPALLSESKFPK